MPKQSIALVISPQPTPNQSTSTLLVLAEQLRKALLDIDGSADTPQIKSIGIRVYEVDVSGLIDEMFGATIRP